jgi:gliding motility-associated-like protein
LTNVYIVDPLPGLVITGGPISLAVGASDSTTFTATYIITQGDVDSGSVVNQATVFGTTPSGSEVSDLSGTVSGTDQPTIVIVESCIIEVFNAVTPNDDGLNDYLSIDGLDCYPDNTLEIYNRWGVKVYDVQGYNNTSVRFNGYSDGRVTIKTSEELPNGTYYYILKYTDSNRNSNQKTGFLYLSK